MVRILNAMEASSNPPTHSRLELAREVVEDLLSELETQDITIDRSLMKAKRLARLLRDPDAQTWLDFEMKGYPSNFNFADLGLCYKYAVSGGRLDPKEGKYWIQSLPELEAMMRVEQQVLGSMEMPRDFSPSVENYLASGATLQVLGSFWARIEVQKKSCQHAAHLFASMKSIYA